MKSHCRSIDLSLGKGSLQHQYGPTRHPPTDLRTVLSDKDRLKAGSGQLEAERQHDLPAGASMKPARLRQARQSDVGSIVPPVCHNHNIDDSNSLVAPSIIQQMEAKRKRLRLDQPTRAVGLALKEYRLDGWSNEDPLLVPNQSQLNKLFRMKVEAAKFLQQLSVNQSSIDTVNNATTKLQLVQYMVRVLRGMCGQQTTPKHSEMTQQSNELSFAKANNDLLASSLTKTKELLEKTRKEWSEACQRLNQREKLLEKSQQEIFKWQRLYQDEKIKRHARHSSEKELSVTVKQMKSCLEMNSREKHELLQAIEDKECMIEHLIIEKEQLTREINRVTAQLEQLREKPSWLEQHRQSIVKLYEQHLLFLSKDREKYGAVFREFEQFIKATDSKPKSPKQFGHQYMPSSTSTSIQVNPLYASRPRSTDCNGSWHNNSVISARPASVHINTKPSEPLPSQYNIARVEERYKKQLELFITENQQLKEELSRITDKCIQFGMLKGLMKEPKSSSKKEFQKIPLTPKASKELLRLSPRNEHASEPRGFAGDTFKKHEQAF